MFNKNKSNAAEYVLKVEDFDHKAHERMVDEEFEKFMLSGEADRAFEEIYEKYR